MRDAPETAKQQFKAPEYEALAERWRNLESTVNIRQCASSQPEASSDD